MNLRKLEDAHAAIENLKSEYKAEIDLKHREAKERTDRMKLELTECWLTISELRREVTSWRDRYQEIREGFE